MCVCVFVFYCPLYFVSEGLVIKKLMYMYIIFLPVAKLYSTVAEMNVVKLTIQCNRLWSLVLNSK